MAVGLAVGLFIVVLVLIVTQPRGLSIGWTAVGGAVVALMLGIVSWNNVATVVGIVWDATLTFVAVILISLILDAVGFFEWSALHMVRLAHGRGRLLFLLIGILGALVAMFFANDGAALILTPIVYAQAKALDLPAKATLALIMTSGFIADTTSLPLVVSNLVNIVSAGYFHLGFGSYAIRMVPVDLVALAASLAVLYLFYRRGLPIDVRTSAVALPSSAIKDHRVFRVAWVILGLLLAGYIASQFLHWPVALFAGSAALALLAAARSSPSVNTLSIVKNAPWKIVVFSVGMYVVVFGLRNVGLTHLLGLVLHALAQHGSLIGIIGTGVVGAVLSSIMNNMPTVLINALAIHDAAVRPAIATTLAYANVVGCDLGPKLTPIGSLATLLWLHVLDRRGVRITWGYYVRVGLTLTIPVLVVTLVALWGWSVLIG
ncbi:MAG: arsenical efflux pump membrane protein ArsB [Sulfobacillus acidophilus]|uniref:Arsenical pump membrane protein n=1 Tax=Sulfobacillus acidophilus TaxID=53633 RepID=A0A2T2WF27_9FIRM|nr:MAG: arsenical efflux pump membrane protein ArsB [Sulfobacillus acidophilus]